MDMSDIKSRVVRIEVLHHTTGLLLGTSPDLPGFSHTASSAVQFEAEIYEAVRDMLEAMGRSSVTVEPMDHISPENGFGLQMLHARIESQAA